MTALRTALRKKFGTPAAAILALDLDPKILDQETPHMKKPTQFACHAALMLGAAVRPLLSKDAKIDLMPVVKDLTAKTFNAKKFQIALDGALKGKLAKDANMQHVAEVMHHLDGMAKGTDESVTEAQHNAMEAAAHGESTLGIPEKVGKEFAKKDAGDEFPKNALDWLKGKMSEDDFAEFSGMDWKGAGDDAEEDNDEQEHAGDPDREETAEGEDGSPDISAKQESARTRAGGMGKDNKRGKGAMDGAISKAELKIALDAQAKAIHSANIAEQREMRAAEKLVGAKVGALDAMTFDSAEALKRHALKLLGNDDYEKCPIGALDTVLKMYPDQGAKAPVVRETSMGMDEASRDSFAKEYEGTCLSDIQVGA